MFNNEENLRADESNMTFILLLLVFRCFTWYLLYDPLKDSYAKAFSVTSKQKL